MTHHGPGTVQVPCAGASIAQPPSGETVGCAPNDTAMANKARSPKPTMKLTNCSLVQITIRAEARVTEGSSQADCLAPQRPDPGQQSESQESPGCCQVPFVCRKSVAGEVVSEHDRKRKDCCRESEKLFDRIRRCAGCGADGGWIKCHCESRFDAVASPHSPLGSTHSDFETTGFACSSGPRAHRQSCPSPEPTVATP